MPTGSKASYTSKQKRMAKHIEDRYERRGVSDKETARRAWGTVNKVTGGAGRKVSSSKAVKVAKSAATSRKNRRPNTKKAGARSRSNVH